MVLLLWRFMVPKSHSSVIETLIIMMMMMMTIATKINSSKSYKSERNNKIMKKKCFKYCHRTGNYVLWMQRQKRFSRFLRNRIFKMSFLNWFGS
jgi:Fe2+ transport system protein B